MKEFRLINHNTPNQRRFGGCDDTVNNLVEGCVYEAEVEEHTWHTKLIIDGKKYNSVCFEEVTDCENLL